MAPSVEPLVDDLDTVGAGTVAQGTTRRGERERLHGRAEHQLEHFGEHLHAVDVVAYEYSADGDAEHPVALARRELEVVEKATHRRLGLLAVELVAQAEQERRGKQQAHRAVLGQDLERRACQSLVEAHARLPGAQDAEALHLGQRLERLGFGQRQAQLGAEALSGERAQGAAGDRRGQQLSGVRLDLEAQARGVARESQDPRRVVAEACVVQDAQAARGEILERSLHRAQPSRLLPGERRPRSR